MDNNIKIRKTKVIDITVVIATLLGIAITVFLYCSYKDFYIKALILGVFVYLGFLLPRFINKKIREDLAHGAKEREFEKWGFHSRDREGPWINFINYPVLKTTDIAKDKYFCGERLIINDGMITVNPGPSTVDKSDNTVKYDYSVKRTYAWDGCTPKKWFYWFILIGTPDFWHKEEKITRLDDSFKPVTKTVFWQQAHHASLIHDALYQYLGIHTISKKDVDKLFYTMLRESGMNFIIANFYHFAVKYFNRIDLRNNVTPPNYTLNTNNK